MFFIFIQFSMKVVTKFLHLKDFFLKMLKLFFREEFFQIQKQNVRNDQINTLVHYFWIRVTRTTGIRREPPPPSGEHFFCEATHVEARDKDGETPLLKAAYCQPAPLW